MPLVVVDTSVALPAVLSPLGLARKFWVLLAYGAVAYRHEHLRLELEALKEQAGPGVELGGVDAVEAMVTRAGDRRAALAELLPYGAPDDWVAAGSTYLFDEFERKVVEVGREARSSDRPRSGSEGAPPVPGDLRHGATSVRCARRSCADTGPNR